MKEKTTVPTRKVTAHEKLYLAAEQRLPGFLIEMVLEGRGIPSSLQEAIKEASRANPGSRLRLKPSAFGLHWEASGEPPTLRTIENQSQTWLSDQDTPPYPALALKDGETCNVVIFPPSTPDGVTRIAIRVFHGASDAGGLTHFVQDVFRVLRGERAMGSGIVPSVPGPVKIMRNLRREFSALANFETNPPPGRGWIRTKGDHGAPAGSIARSACALASLLGTGTMNIQVPVDLRSYLPGDERLMGNHTRPLFIEVNQASEWQSIQQEIKRGLINREAVRLNLAEPLLLLASVDQIQKEMRRRMNAARQDRRFEISATIAKISLPNLESLSGGGFQCERFFYAPAATDILPLSLSISGDKNNFDLIVGAYRSIVSNAKLQEITDAVHRSLGVDSSASS